MLPMRTSGALATSQENISCCRIKTQTWRLFYWLTRVLSLIGILKFNNFQYNKKSFNIELGLGINMSDSMTLFLQAI